MPETISLRAYLGKVDDLLRVGQVDEAIHHCRHILQYFPRNVAAYKLLGRALLQNRRWDEARAVFQRVLSVRPDDFDTHIGLCEVYEQKGQSSDAIWHMERAFEQRPTDRALIDRLRDLYRQHRNVDHARIQLTAAAVARQQAGAGYSDRALETLRGVLARSPDRLDLRLLLARTLWESDQRVEAAETALDVLEKLPDAIDANTIMTRLWLSEERPSDAQRFLNRLEALDPYLALELVQGQPVGDEVFTLDELDYRRVAQSEMTTNKPDWLEGLDTTEFKDLFGGNTPRPSVASLTDRLRPTPAAAAEPEEDDWAGLFDAPSDKTATSQTPKVVSTDDLFADLPDEWSEEWASSAEQPSSLGDTGSLFGIEQPTEATEAPLTIESPFDEELPKIEEELPWLQNTADTIKPASVTSTLRVPKPEDLPGSAPLDWASDIPDDPTFQQFMDENESVTITPEKIDPLQWLRSTGAEIDENKQRERPGLYDDEGAGGVIADPSADPLSWMRGSGIEYDGQMVGDAANGDSDDMDWINDELPGTPEAATQADGETDLDFFTWLEQQQQSNRVNASDVTIDDDPLEWLNDDTLLAGLDQDDDIPGEVDARSPFDRPGGDAGSGTMRLDDPMPASLMAQMQISQEASFDSTGGRDTLATLEQADEAERQEAMADKGDKHGPDWLNDDSKDDLEWLNNSGAQDSDANAHLADWLSRGLGDDEEEEEESPLTNFDWTPSAGASDEAEPDAELESSVPDWLADLGPGYTQPETARASAAGDSEEDAAQSDEELTPTEMPDWLSELGPTYGQPETLPTFPADDAEPEAAQAETSLEWLDRATTSEPAVAETEAQPATPDWISAMDAQTAVSMATVSDEEAEPAEMPDWMAELAPESASETPSLEWLDNAPAAEAPVEAEPAAETPVAAELPDWMNEAQPAAEAPVAAELPDWMSEAQPTAETPVAAELPDWMAELEPETMPETASLEWLDPGAPTAETPADVEPVAETPMAAEVPDWSPEPEGGVASSLEWLDDGAPEVASALPSEQPNASSFDWVNDIAGSDEPESELDELLADPATSLSDIAAAEQPPQTDFEWISEAQENTPPPPVEPVMVAQGDDEPEVDFPPELSFAASVESETSGGFDWDSGAKQADVPDWLSELKEPEKEPEAPAAQSEQSFSWLDIGEQPAQPNTEADMPTWLRSGPEDEQAEEPAASAEEIDWLSGIGAQPPAQPLEPQFAYDSGSAELFGADDEPEDDLENVPTSAPVVTNMLDDDFDLSESVAAEHTPAENAPDWLNAMVPGVDLDYAPAEDEPVEQFDEETSPTKEFNWLLELVEEETQPAQEAPPAPAPAPAAVQAETPQPKFSFSKAPSWLRKGGDATAR